MKRSRPKTTIRSAFHVRSFSRAPSFPLLVLIFVLVLSCLSPLSKAAASDKKLKPTDDYALIFGTVWGPDDRPVYGVTVKIRRLPGKKAKWELYSDHSGEFAQRVPAGEADYIISADLKGVKATDGKPLHLAEEVTVHIENNERADMSLHLTR
jgi:hypothetical protein